MASVDPWDPILEAATTALDRLTGGSRTGRVLVRTGADWIVEFRTSGRTLSVQMTAPETERSANLGDYQLAVLFAAGMRPTGRPGRPSGFLKSLTLNEGFRWDEQSLREVVLEAIGLLRFVVGADDADAAVLEQEARVPTLNRPKLRRRR